MIRIPSQAGGRAKEKVIFIHLQLHSVHESVEIAANVSEESSNGTWWNNLGRNGQRVAKGS